ncbi:hypothetical protein MHLP_03355 [Candidatus Mycoplasma haematolamae str. Purdue]|uniref:Uncharacterized protein n=1 Tax=Mycoplasma haematolamae (strain Purdue) TaxID=1212765 RepID=I7CG73_MYCHA|nr:hypothetical protein [Candidatus Mycoplasma haematolamae]AFO52251.1 hypothetical protein MHLP_03355 [Candidatus Mycoplasma haematolamae str. Purdue]
MVLTTKVQIGAALVGLGGANAAAITAFKEPLKDLLLSQSDLNLSGSSLDNPVSSLTLGSSTRSGLNVSEVSSSLSSPLLDLHSESTPIALEGLSVKGEGSKEFGPHIDSLRVELGKESELLSIAKKHSETKEKELKSLEEKKKEFESAVKKVTDYASKSSSKLVALTKEEREALARAYKVYAALKQADEEAQTRLSRLQTGSRSRRSTSAGKTDREVRDLLNAIYWRLNATRFLSDFSKRDADNYGFDRDWSKNPWRAFFDRENLWRKFWDERDNIRRELFDWRDDLKEDYRNGQCHRLQIVESRELCISEVPGRIKSTFPEANIKIDLHVAQKILFWMGLAEDPSKNLS